MPRLCGYAALAPAALAGVYALAIRPWHQRWGRND